jgi:predicted NAD/FAD-dependent oxidoreductase
MVMMKKKNIAIIGAGIAGLVCAVKLSDTFNVTLFEKSRGVSGRTSTRYADNFEFDHGTPYFTARTQKFKNFVKTLCDEKIIAEWTPKIESVSLQRDSFKKLWFEPHYVGFNRMNDIAKFLASKITDNHKIHLGTEIHQIQKDSDTIKLTDKNNIIYDGFDNVIITAPAVQTFNLLPVDIAYRDHIKDIQMSAAYCLMIGSNTQWTKKTAVFDCDDDMIAKIMVNSHKPNRNNAVTCLVAESMPQWALDNVDADIPTMQEILLQRTLDLLKLPNLQIDFITTHRWRYARPQNHISYPYLWDNDFKIGVCSDWCHSDETDKNIYGVESAYLSAAALSDFLL